MQAQFSHIYKLYSAGEESELNQLSVSVFDHWLSKAVCIIRTTKVQILPLNQVTEVHARIEGEGDGLLDWWRKAHWDYYHHELQGTGYEPRPDMPIVFQEFERIFPAGSA